MGDEQAAKGGGGAGGKIQIPECTAELCKGGANFLWTFLFFFLEILSSIVGLSFASVRFFRRLRRSVSAVSCFHWLFLMELYFLICHLSLRRGRCPREMPRGAPWRPGGGVFPPRRILGTPPGRKGTLNPNPA